MKKLTICWPKGVPGQYTVEQALSSGIFDKIVVSTDSKKIVEMVKSLGLNPWFIRPNNLSKDRTPKYPSFDML